MAPTRVLIVDDDPDIVDAIAMVLRHAGHETATAEHGVAALERLRDGFGASVILLDLMMPVMDGETFLAEQHRDPRLAQIPVVVFSGDPARLVAARGPQVAARLRKPIDLPDLLGTLDAAVRR